eukprot:6064897-Pyramimonas_sp.AAC.2
MEFRTALAGGTVPLSSEVHRSLRAFRTSADTESTTDLSSGVTCFAVLGFRITPGRSIIADVGIVRGRTPTSVGF